MVGLWSIQICVNLGQKSLSLNSTPASFAILALTTLNHFEECTSYALYGG
jgi:hypothetical protein